MAEDKAAVPVLTNLTLNEARRQRKQVQLDVRALENRIHLLEKEEKKAKSRILQTKNRALDILKLRKENEKRKIEANLTDRYQVKSNEARKTRPGMDQKSNEQRYIEKQLARAARKKQREVIELQKRREAKEFRKAKRKHEEELQNQKKLSMKKLYKIRDQVKQERLRAQLKLEKMKEDNRLKSQVEYFRRIEKEKKDMRKYEQKAVMLESKELHMIGKLHKTKALQKAAYDKLESALGQTLHVREHEEGKHTGDVRVESK